MRCIALSAIQLGATPIDLFRGETYGALSVKRSWLFTTVSYLSLQMYRSKAAPPPHRPSSPIPRSGSLFSSQTLFLRQRTHRK